MRRAASGEHALHVDEGQNYDTVTTVSLSNEARQRILYRSSDIAGMSHIGAIISFSRASMTLPAMKHCEMPSLDLKVKALIGDAQKSTP